MPQRGGAFWLKDAPKKRNKCTFSNLSCMPILTTKKNNFGFNFDTFFGVSTQYKYKEEDIKES